MSVKISISGLNPSKVADRIIDDKAKLFFANNVARRMEQFWAKDTGTLSTTHDIQPDYIHYTQPYAHYMYVGKLYLASNGSAWAKSGERKHKTSTKINYSRDKNPLATSYPDKAMMRKDGEALADEMTDYFRRR